MVLKMNANVTDKQIQKAYELKSVFKKFEKSKLTVKEFCEKNNVTTRKFYYWKPRYESDGIKGLVDQRKGTPYKITNKERKFIQETKIINRSKSGADLVEDIYKKFKKSISSRQINRVLEDLGLNDPVGRKHGKKLKKN